MRVVVLLAAVLCLPAIALADPSNKIPFYPKLTMKLGQSVIVNGFRGDCGERPKNVNVKRTRDTELGVLSIGKWGVKKSRSCAGWTPAVEVIFTARKRGTETFNVNGDDIRVTVK